MNNVTPVTRGEHAPADAGNLRVIFRCPSSEGARHGETPPPDVCCYPDLCRETASPLRPQRRTVDETA